MHFAKIFKFHYEEQIRMDIIVQFGLIRTQWKYRYHYDDDKRKEGVLYLGVLGWKCHDNMCYDEYDQVIALYFRLEWELEYYSKGGKNSKVQKQI